MNRLEEFAENRRNQEKLHRKSELTLICKIRSENEIKNLDSPLTIYTSELMDADGSGDTTSSIEANLDEIDRDVSLGQMLIISEFKTTYSRLIDLYLENEIYKVFDNRKEIEVIEPKGGNIEDAIIVEWSWEKYVGYCRNFHGLRRGGYNETESNLVSGNEESTFKRNESVLLTKEETKGLTDEELHEAVREELFKNSWKWNYFKNNPSESKITQDLGLKIHEEEEF